MKALLLALGSLVVGVVIGLVMTQREFARDVLPTSQLREAESSADQTGRGPHAVVVGGEIHRFGTLNRGSTGRHVFKIRNDGDRPLTLVPGKTTCKCTKFQVSPATLPPGETANVELEWKPVTVDSGFEQQAEVMVPNDPTHPVITFTIAGRVIDLVQPELPEIVFSDLSTSLPARSRLRIFNYKGPELNVEKHEWLQPSGVDQFRVSFEPLSPEEVENQEDAKSGVALLLEVSPGLPLGPLANTLRLTVSEPGVEPLNIHVAGTVTSDLALSGPRTLPDKLRVDLGVVARPAGLKTTVYLLSKGPHRDETTLSLGKVDPSEEFRVTLGEPLRDNPRVYRYPLTIEIPPNARPVAHSGEGNSATIQVLATHPSVKELTIKVRYVVKDD